MILAKRAPVKPRVICPRSQASVLLEDEIQELIDAGRAGIVQLVGPPGSGKTTALKHLAAVMPANANAVLLDDPSSGEVYRLAKTHSVIFTNRSPDASEAYSVYRLTPWGRDDLIEYLLAVHKDQCSSVMRRVCAADLAQFRGIPELWQPALEVLAGDYSIPDAQRALVWYLQQKCPTQQDWDQATAACLDVVRLRVKDPESMLVKHEVSGSLIRLLRHEAAQILMGAEDIVADLRTQAACNYLALPLPRELICTAGALIAAEKGVTELIRALFEQSAANQAMVASLLHFANPHWVPPKGRAIGSLSRAFLDNVIWPGVDLTNAYLTKTDLSQADLRRAVLDRATAQEANFRQANLTGASLEAMAASQADFSYATLSSARAELAQFPLANLEGADLTGSILKGAGFAQANLTSAKFNGADLTSATLSPSIIEDADFSGANLERANLSWLRLNQAIFEGARFPGAKLQGCDLEFLHLAGTDFHNADLSDAYLTGSEMPDANFTKANLRNTGLADIHWERACLQDANLTGASFHLGSTRSGKLITPFASEGTRTGFYTDDFDEQIFKEPEEIRKANLRGADLRGAYILGVDFYLVDVRDALYDADQESHLRWCGAILV